MVAVKEKLGNCTKTRWIHADSLYGTHKFLILLEFFWFVSTQWGTNSQLPTVTCSRTWKYLQKMQTSKFLSCWRAKSCGFFFNLVPHSQLTDRGWCEFLTNVCENTDTRTTLPADGVWLRGRSGKKKKGTLWVWVEIQLGLWYSRRGI